VPHVYCQGCPSIGLIAITLPRAFRNAGDDHSQVLTAKSKWLNFSKLIGVMAALVMCSTNERHFSELKCFQLTVWVHFSFNLQLRGLMFLKPFISNYFEMPRAYLCRNNESINSGKRVKFKKINRDCCKRWYEKDQILFGRSTSQVFLQVTCNHLVLAVV
jgi:hypothetical protein